MKILTAQQMREMDRLTVERCGIPFPTLMETAGSRVVEAIIEHYGPVSGKSFAVYCGRGNNGGDGAVIARLLWMSGAIVDALLFGDIEKTKGEARTNFEILRQLASTDPSTCGRGALSFTQIASDDADLFKASQFIIDALFGTGLTKPAEGIYARAIEAINESRRLLQTTVIAVDIPSGLSSDAAQPIGPHVEADLTVSFTAPKIGNALPPACYANGKLVVASIGTPDELLAKSGAQLQLVAEEQIIKWLRASRRAPDAHKGSVGDVLLIAGSRGKTGAAALASEAVLRAGAGLVTVATAQSAQALLVTQARTEVMTEPLSETGSGAIAHDALERAFELAQKRTVIAIGPGLSSADESTRSFARKFVAQRNAPVVIDADGLNCLAPWPDELSGSDQLPIIVTPHPGEMARLSGRTNAEIVADRISAAREFAMKNHVITILKGSRTLIAAPDGEVYVNPTGNAGMATAGSGDVLTGLLAGLLAQRPAEPLQAAIAAVYLHGLAGDIAAGEIGMRSLMAGDISNRISAAILRTGGEEEKGSHE
ncbi:MAG TPA: NAD(P)H-hydrate dehydratase [Blastocatellia bacterium]|nr:NAD(P)H-hydrate dehydratase [Blastocatellia bacterium]